MEVKIVLGHAFGDEGKGVTVQWLCKKAIEEGKKPIVVRFSGGPQCSHTVVNNGIEHICATFGSGVLLGVPTVLFPNTFVDPICLMNEYRVLKEKGIEPQIDLCCNRIITPYDVLAGQSNEKVLSDGTCGKGLFPTFDRCNGNFPLVYQFNSYHRPEHYLSFASKYHNIKRDDEYDQMFTEAFNDIRNLFSENIAVIDYDVVIFEGSQGLLLDMDCGFFPHVTPSKVGLNGIFKPDWFLKGAEVYLVTRTYTTRHGKGYTPLQPHHLDLSEKRETNVNNKYQGEFKTGALEIPLLNRAYERHCIDNYVKKYDMTLNLVVTHADVVKDEFWYVDHNEVYSHINCHGINWIPDLFYGALNYTPSKIFYNDSPESNIKQAI